MQSPTLLQIVAVYNLVRAGRKIAASGALPEADEATLRRCIAEAEVQFLLPPEPINDNLTDSDWSAGNDVVRDAINSAETVGA